MILKKSLTNALFKTCSGTVFKIQTAQIANRSLIGNRDWVGFGSNGRACYADDLGLPFPAIRFKENTNELLALREKEKGDWRKLTIEEKKILYRASFRQTFAEWLAPTGEWKMRVAFVLMALSGVIWIFYLEHKYICRPLPFTFSQEHKAKVLRYMLDFKMGHLTGISSKWDYEKDDWKK